MSFTVTHNPSFTVMDWPWVVGNSAILARAPNERIATRVAAALQLQSDIEAANASAKLAPRQLREDEIMVRAREAAIAEEFVVSSRHQEVRTGAFDGISPIKAAARALRDLSKPLADLVPPPVDPDLIEARKIAAAMCRGTALIPGHDPVTEEIADNIEKGTEDRAEIVQASLTAIKRGREMALDELLTPEGVRKLTA
jgi:hypothetical protein